MRNLWVAILILAAGSYGVQALLEPAGEPAGDQSAPAVAFERFNGEPVTLTDYSLGRPLVLNFWASWCAPCTEEMPAFQRVYLDYSEQVSFLGVNTQDAVADARRMIEQTGVGYSLARDPRRKLFAAFGARGMPSTYFISAEGTIVDQRTGPLTEEALRSKVQGLLDTD